MSEPKQEALSGREKQVKLAKRAGKLVREQFLLVAFKA